MTNRIMWLALPALLAAAGPAPAADEATVDLSGVWVLNARASDDPAAAVQQVTEGTRPRRARDHDEAAEPGRGGEREDPGQAGRQERTRQRIGRLEIFTGGGEFNLTDGLDITRLLHTDGRTETIWTEYGEAQAAARWNGPALEVTWSGSGPARLSRFQLSPDGSQLYVLEQFAPPGMTEPVTVHLVYDRQP